MLNYSVFYFFKNTLRDDLINKLTVKILSICI